MIWPWPLLLPLSLVLISYSVKTNAKDSNANFYRGLYGRGKDNVPPLEALLKVASGGIKFILEDIELNSKELRDVTPRQNQEYDFIIVGAGSAGATIASRLSEIPDVTVLLIEAGSNENFIMDVPVLTNILQESADLNWMYQTEPSNTLFQGLRDNRCNWPAGKAMGGTSVVNYMIATRGNPENYDDWERMGNEGWSYADVLPYFKKLEQIGIEELRLDHTMHNTNGPLYIAYPPYHTPVATGFVKAGEELGYPIVDYNAQQYIGFSYLQATVKNGTRMSVNRAYLYPVKHRKNLFVTKLSHVNRILIDENKRAYGVEFTKHHTTIRVRARKEVILSAGTIGSPKLLMLSGIGPARHLRNLGIKVVQDLPVGKNLIDHVTYPALIFLIDQPSSILASDLWDPLKPYMADFLQRRKGPATVPGGTEAIAFINVDEPERLDVPPNIELLFFGASIIAESSFRKTIGISQKHWDKYFAPIYGRYSWSITPVVVQPRSRGEILLRSKNPKDKPKIFPNYYDDPEDMRLAIKSIRAAINISKTKAMRQFNSKLYSVPVPGCEKYKYDSDEYWVCAIKTYGTTFYHYVGTNKMAPEDDVTGVVNPRLQVNGIHRLRVADASIMPTIISGHLNIPTIMIGEKLSDMVKEDWGYKTRK